MTFKLWKRCNFYLKLVSMNCWLLLYSLIQCSIYIRLHPTHVATPGRQTQHGIFLETATVLCLACQAIPSLPQKLEIIPVSHSPPRHTLPGCFRTLHDKTRLYTEEPLIVTSHLWTRQLLLYQVS